MPWQLSVSECRSVEVETFFEQTSLEYSFFELFHSNHLSYIRRIFELLSVDQSFSIHMKLWRTF